MVALKVSWCGISALLAAAPPTVQHHGADIPVSLPLFLPSPVPPFPFHAPRHQAVLLRFPPLPPISVSVSVLVRLGQPSGRGAARTAPQR